MSGFCATCFENERSDISPISVFELLLFETAQPRSSIRQKGFPSLDPEPPTVEFTTSLPRALFVKKVIVREVLQRELDCNFGNKNVNQGPTNDVDCPD